MKISKRLLIKWRKEALIDRENWQKGKGIPLEVKTPVYLERFLRMTQDLYDQYLLKERNEK